MLFGAAVVNVVRATRKQLGVPTYLVAVGTDSRGMAVTQVLPYPWQPTTQLVRDFTALVEREKFGLDYEHMLGYFNVRVFAFWLLGADWTRPGFGPAADSLSLLRQRK